MSENPVFYDTDCLSSFLYVQRTDILKNLFSKIIVPEYVFDEILNFGTPDIIKSNFKMLLASGFVEIYKFEVFSKEYFDFLSIKEGNWSETFKVIGKGESAAISLAYNKNGIMASNNLKDVKEYVYKFNLKLITSSFILAKSFENSFISKEEANYIWIK